MLLELRVENLLLIERAELALAPGLNVLTGETGAGKTVLAHALDLLLGGRARPGIVRPGAAEAYVEGVFELPDELRAELGDRIAPDSEEIVLARRVSAEGRTRALLNGRSATAADLREAGAALLSFYGQHEHRRLMLSSAQLDVLDSFCGEAQVAVRARCAIAHARRRTAEVRLAELTDRAGARERELDLLRFELAEIEAAEPSVEEHAELLGERERLRHLEGLRGAAAAGAEALAPAGGEPGTAALLAEAGRGFDAVEGVDPALDELGERHRALVLEADDLAADLRRYEESVDAPPGRLVQVEERLADLDRLARKHGGSIAGVLAHAEDCRARGAALEGAESALEEVGAELEAARREHEEAALALHEARAAAADPLAAAVRERLEALAMESAGFEVSLSERADPGPLGSDEVEFRIAPNPGVPAGALRDIASGGELSRVMLALMSAASAGGGAALVFDEVDAGIGGQTARAVGEQLRELAAGRQVLCITHLPQVASLAARHFTIAKETAGGVTRATVARLADRELVGELVRMLGADEADTGARRHAKELLAAA
jgi:DNA repair protein RecN (Recombination protein N)